MKVKHVFMLLVLVCGGFIIALLIQNKKIQVLANALWQVNQKADQSNLAAGVALQQTSELIEGQQANQQKMTEEWNAREPIGFKSQKNKTT